MIKIILSLKNQDLKSLLKSEIQKSLRDYPKKIIFAHEDYIKDDSNSENLLFFFELVDSSDIKKAELMKERNEADCIIFLSEDETLVFKSLRVKPIQFIRLNNFDEDFKNMIEVLIDYLQNTDRVLTLKSGTTIFRLNVKSIIFIESFGHYLSFHAINGNYQVRGKLSDIIEEINNPYFIRTHKSYIVNISFVERVLSDKLILKSDLEVPIGRNFKDEVIESYHKFAT
ncbi:LytR/AlgR family response regulator transcription factor [Clostridium cellulovorans]|uniref:Response regulator receiver protein n=1 Tax=Clostridium cellulovorans (strain ATCC 35296 / DSM 3052 / OCM 3 / 743B) TaxID=573061 RepID=D9STZ7_CLOC7|nr:response regulator transcription factor [Clostridium cellulovorans]ADL50835.1 response regulator receiver protein [Clostridium cellulovorans 743B]